MGSALAVQEVDQVKAFMLYAYFGGDAVKTAQACATETKTIVALAHDFEWAERIKGQNRLDTDEGLKLEQQANRARNYVMAQRIGMLVEQVALQAAADPEKWVDVNCIDVHPVTGEKTFDPKPLADIAKAAQIVQDMTYRATGDKMAATAGTTAASDGSVTNLMVNVYAGLDKLKHAAAKVAARVSPEHPDAVIDVVTKP